MKNLKKLSAMLLALMIALMIPLSAFATSVESVSATTVEAENNSTATFNVATGNANDNLAAYKVVDVNFDKASYNLTFDFTQTFKDFLDSSYGTAYQGLTVDQYCDYIDKTEDDDAAAMDVKEILGAFTAYIKSLQTMPAAAYTATTDENGAATFTNVAYGQYIILGDGSSTGALIYETVTAEFVPYVQDGKYMVWSSYDVGMKTSKAEATKVIKAGTFIDDNKHTASIGDKIDFNLNVTIPTYPAGATNKTFYINDSALAGLTLPQAADSLVVVGNDATGTNPTTLTLDDEYTVELNDNQFYIDFDFDKIKSYVSIDVDYSAYLNENAILGSANGTENTMSLVYANSPFEGTTYDPLARAARPDGQVAAYTASVSSETIYTYSLGVDKIAAGTQTKLANATFEIYTEYACTNKVGEITTDTNGYAVFDGLKAGTYFLKETVAPAGYKLLNEPVEVNLKAESFTHNTETTKAVTYTPVADNAMYAAQAIDESGKKLWFAADAQAGDTPTNVYQNGYVPAYVASIVSSVDAITESADAAVSGIVVQIENVELGNLPSTGGMGTVIFVVVGLVLMAGAVVAFVVKKRPSVA